MCTVISLVTPALQQLQWEENQALCQINTCWLWDKSYPKHIVWKSSLPSHKPAELRSTAITAALLTAPAAFLQWLMGSHSSRSTCSTSEPPFLKLPHPLLQRVETPCRAELPGTCPPCGLPRYYSTPTLKNHISSLHLLGQNLFYSH